MKRFYYMARSLVGVKGITRDLSKVGIGENRLHVVGSNPSELDRAKVHYATPLEETDVMHSGYVGAWWGFYAGLISGFVLVFSNPWGIQLGITAFLAATLFFTCFGAWLGGLLGVSMPNHHLVPFMRRMRRHQYLVFIDTDNEHQTQRMREVMRTHKRDVEELGSEDNYSPFN